MKTEFAAQSAEGQTRRLESVYEGVAGLLSRPDIAQRARVAPSEEEWSVVQILGHMVEIVPYWHGLYHKIIAAAGEPPEFGQPLDAPERLAAVQRPESEEPDELLRFLNEEVRPAARAIRQG
jgi:hypothetical protein